MAKITLREKWETLEHLEKEIKDNHISVFFKTNKKPKELFQMNFFGDISKPEITGFSVSYHSDKLRVLPPYLEAGKAPTNKLVSEYEDYINKIKICDRRILVSYRVGNTTGAYGYLDIVPTNMTAFSKEDLESESKKRAGLYVPREGYLPCTYCKKQVQENAAIETTIIGRGRKQVYNSWKKRYEGKAYCTHESLKFCSNDCASNEQMSREG